MGYLQYQEDERAALEELGRLLRPNGVLVVSGPVLNTLAGGLGLGRAVDAAKYRLRHTRIFQSLRAVRQRLRGAPHDQSEVDSVISQISTHRYGVRRFRNLLADSGFDLLDWQGHGFVGFPGHGCIGLQAEIAAHRAFGALARVLPISRFGNDLVGVARKRASRGA
jgi:hypothetical protein